uniref:Uncharacterized protein n=1 Tax=Anopheles maculatus TaxID=74869 RepID=A0A182SZV3_9DIPT
MTHHPKAYHVKRESIDSMRPVRSGVYINAQRFSLIERSTVVHPAVAIKLTSLGCQLPPAGLWLIVTSAWPGCLLDGVPPSAPPDVPPRNPTMNRMNGRVTGNPTELGVDFEPSCLVRTPSGNVYIPSGTLVGTNVCRHGG